MLICINLAVLALPLAGIQLMRIYESALVRQTESALIAQAAFVAAFYRSLAQEALTGSVDSIGREVTTLNPQWRDGRWSPRPAVLDLAASETLPPFPDGVPADAAQAFAAGVGARLAPVLADAQLVTLAGIRVVDSAGTIVASTGDDVGLSIAHGVEIERALTGESVSSLRRKSEVVRATGLDSISRAGGVRVFVSAPILLRERLIGAVMLSRTPPSIVQALYAKRWLLLQALGLLVAVVLLMSLLTFRLIARPVSDLAERASRISGGETGALTGMRTPRILEIARLQQAITGMAETLEQRASYLEDFARHVSHEFKTPIAGIRAAIEVLEDHGEDMSETQRQQFLENVAADARRLHRLTERLMDLTRAELRGSDPVPVALEAVVADSVTAYAEQAAFDTARVAAASVAAQPEMLCAVLETLFENAIQHEATELTLWTERADGRLELHVQDNGRGISESNRVRIFEPFFTTARGTGGTGLGLTIATALLRQCGGSLELVSGNGPTTFRVSLSEARPPT